MSGELIDETNGAHHLANVLAHHAHHRPKKIAVTLLGDDNAEVGSLTYAQLLDQSFIVSRLIVDSTNEGDRVLLVFPNNLEFIVGFFACQLAGVVPVPIVPNWGKRLRQTAFGIIRDCQPSMTLTNVTNVEQLSQTFREEADLAQIPVRGIMVDLENRDGQSNRDQNTRQSSLAFLQYTSGSTSAPKGVVVGQSQLFANLSMMTDAFHSTSHCIYVGWAPLHHDMGLIANLLQPIRLGARVILMKPSMFAAKPWLWLQAVSFYKASVSGGPNYAYDLCAERRDNILQRGDIDLSSWRIAFNSAEPVRADTISKFGDAFEGTGFRLDATYPCYGMAEATLLISGTDGPRKPLIMRISRSGMKSGKLIPANRTRHDDQEIVACGSALKKERIAIVDTETMQIANDGQIGEVFVGGPHVAVGYWNNPEETSKIFHNDIVGEKCRFLRTGDLGVLQNGELFLTGRTKDLIILRGRNIYPHDVEWIVENSVEGLRKNANALFQAESGQLVLVMEVERTARSTFDKIANAKLIRKVVMDCFEFSLHRVLFVMPSSIPKTSSGKIRRSEVKRRWRLNELQML